MDKKLITTNHDRNVAGLKYIYPVLSRRAGGLSIGVNFNTNNACNWRCVYCQVPNLVRGTAPIMDFNILEDELRFFLEYVLKGRFYDDFNVPMQHQVIKDIAISGNGEPTSLKQLDKAIAMVADIALEFGVLPRSNFVLISNGSLMQNSNVQGGLKVFNQYGGQVWYKLDSATVAGRKSINDSKQTNERTLENLKIVASMCETSLQTCLIDYLGREQVKKEWDEYLLLLQDVKSMEINIKKIMLYTIARPSLQPEANKLSKLGKKQLELFSDDLKSLGYQVSISL